MPTAKVDGQQFYFTAGQRKSVKLVYGGYQYVKFMENSKGVKWICSTRSTTKCKARVRTTKNAELEVLHEKHNHSFIQKRYARKVDDLVETKLNINHEIMPTNISSN
ncbi:uncharacterized protein LOC129236011 [Anastrepha obliqua]|uniref:uncharacterized protein LOC128855299 n=1 Tax=Anastrepha ludens TaxID=28586 RepID=UPI0023AE78EA|nr:uncharacterized protein LOC128855299 [Anastrepha ludens]XP_054726139.1 uncharacterized protein LOC129236011 [Anastrepha obliqua]